MGTVVRIALADALDVRRACDAVDCGRGDCHLAPCELRVARGQGTAGEWFRACHRECVEQVGLYLERVWREQDVNQLRLDVGGAS